MSICGFCGTHCDFNETEELFSMVEINKVRLRASINNIMIDVYCDLCGKRNLKWKDEKIKCKSCGELI